MFVKQYTSKNTFAYRYLPPEEETQKSKGEVLCLISINAQGQDDSNRMAKFVWDSLIDEYIYSQLGPLESLKSALKAAENQLKTIIHNDSRLDGVGVDMNITIAAIKGENCYIAYNGDHNVVLKRGENWIDISEILRKHKVIAGSTQINEDDLLLIMTNGMRDAVLKDGFSFVDASAIEKIIGNKEGLLIITKNELGSEPIFEVEPVVEEKPVEVEEEIIPIETIEINETNSQEIEKTDEIEEGSPEYLDQTIADNDRQEQERMEQTIPSLRSISERSPSELPEIGYGTFTETTEEPMESNLAPVQSKIGKLDKIKGVFSKARNKASEIKNKTKNSMEHGKAKGFINIIKKIFSVIGKIFGFIADKIGSLFSWIGDKIKLFFDGKLGHKVWYKKMMSKVSLMRISPNAGNVKGMRIDYYRDQDSRKKKIGAVIVVIIIIIAGYIGVKQAMLRGEQKKVHDQVVLILTDASTYINNAETKANSDATSAQIDLQKAEEKIVAAEGLAIWDEDIATITDLKGQAQNVDDTINRRVGIMESNNSIELFMDTKISFGQNSNPSDMAAFRNTLSNEFLFLSDKGESASYAVSLYDKSVTKIPDSQGNVSNPITISSGSLVDGELYAIYIYDSNNGVVRSLYENGNYGEFQKLTGLSGESLSNKNITDISVLTLNSNVYLLSRTDKSVLKSVRDDFGSYGVTQQYIQSDLLAQGNGILADEYYVYTINTGTQGLQRWQGGQEVGFELVDVNPGLQNVTAGYTGEKMSQRMYLFDKGENRIVVLEKGDDATGTHPNQYIMLKQIVYRGDRTDVFNDVKSLVVDWNEEYLYVLDGLRVWRVQL